MNTFITISLILHVASGFAALLTGGIASLTKKGADSHRRSGKWYFWSMTGVFVTAVIVSVLKENTFLFMVGFFSYYLVVRGYRHLYLKGLGKTQNTGLLDWFITGSALLFGLSLVVFAVWQQTKGISFWPVPFVFGAISLGFAAADVKLYIKGPATKLHWLAGHIGSMGGGYVATWTAFVVTNVKFMPPVITWLLPSLIGAVLIVRSTRRYTKPKAKEILTVQVA